VPGLVSQILHVRKRAFRREPPAVSAARAWEASPPAGATPLEWLPLTGEPAGTPADIERTARTHSCRMQIEAFHTGQKSGMSVEGCQVQSAKKTGAAAAVLSVIAAALTNLRLAVRDPGLASRTATDIVPAVWGEALSRHRKGRPKEWTVAELWNALARLGGHLTLQRSD